MEHRHLRSSHRMLSRRFLRHQRAHLQLRRGKKPTSLFRRPRQAHTAPISALQPVRLRGIFRPIYRRCYGSKWMYRSRRRSRGPATARSPVTAPRAIRGPEGDSGLGSWFPALPASGDVGRTGHPAIGGVSLPISGRGCATAWRDRRERYSCARHRGRSSSGPARGWANKNWGQHQDRPDSGSAAPLLVRRHAHST